MTLQVKEESFIPISIGGLLGELAGWSTCGLWSKGGKSQRDVRGLRDIQGIAVSTDLCFTGRLVI